jgi:uncharacterized protein YjiS (DUF1127 family)
MRIVSTLSESGHRYSSMPQTKRRIAWRRLPKAVFGRAVAVLREWRQRSRERAQLATLDERMLRDIGISRGDVLREINKPFWRV